MTALYFWEHYPSQRLLQGKTVEKLAEELIPVSHNQFSTRKCQKITFFYILDQCYEQCREEDLGGFLGVISPEIWEDGKPMDKAIFNDWQRIINPKTVIEKNVIKKTYDFIVYYEKQFGFKFSRTKQWLISLNNEEIVENAVRKTKEIYQKFNYDD